MKKKILIAALATLAVSLSLVSASCDGSAETVSISDILVYDSGTSTYAYEGKKVSLTNLLVTGNHGAVLSCTEPNDVTTIEVIQKKINPDAVMRTYVNVTGTVTNTNGRATITNATVEVANDEKLTYGQFYVTSGMTRQAGFDSYGRESSGILATNVPLRIVSYNGASEYVSGEDLIITVAYQGVDYTDVWYWLDLVLWGDSDQDTIDFYNAFFFGTATSVTWNDPFNSRYYRTTLPAGWEGFKEGDYITGVFHFYYDEEINPDFGTCFYLDNFCIPWIDDLGLYNEESEITDLIDALSQAYEEGDSTKAEYSMEASWSEIVGPDISRSNIPSTTTDFNRYLEGAATSTFNYAVTANLDYYSLIASVDYIDDDGNTATDYEIDVLRNYYDSTSSTQATIWLEFYDLNEYTAYMAQTDPTNYLSYSSVDEQGYYSGSWTDYLYSLYDMSAYRTSFHKETGAVSRVDSTGSRVSLSLYDVNDFTCADALWDSLVGFFMGYSETYEYYGMMFDLESVGYSKSAAWLYTDFVYGDGWFYYISDPNTLFYMKDEVSCDIHFASTLLS